jgi:hypothetical protein
LTFAAIRRSSSGVNETFTVALRDGLQKNSGDNSL